MSKNELSVAVNLVVFNGVRWLPFCLYSLINQTDSDFSLLIIDNNSADGSLDLINQFLDTEPMLKERTRIVRNKSNLGFARAHNQALAWSKSDLVLLVNQDVVLSPSYIHDLRAKFVDENLASATGKILHYPIARIKDENLAAVHQRVTRHELSVNSQVDYTPMLAECRQRLETIYDAKLNQLIDSCGLWMERSRRVVDIGHSQVDSGQFNDKAEVFGVSGAAPMYRREAIEFVSPFNELLDESFVSYKEDVDLAYRLRWAGYRAILVSDTLAWHDRNLSVDETGGLKKLIKLRRTWPSELRVYSWSNHLATLLKNESIGNLFKDLPYITWFEFKKIIYLIIFEPNVLGRGIKHFCKRFFKLTNKRRLLKLTHRISAGDMRIWFKPYG